jgi:hypothetical protein
MVIAFYFVLLILAFVPIVGMWALNLWLFVLLVRLAG